MKNMVDFFFFGGGGTRGTILGTPWIWGNVSKIHSFLDAHGSRLQFSRDAVVTKSERYVSILPSWLRARRNLLYTYDVDAGFHDPARRSTTSF